MLRFGILGAGRMGHIHAQNILPLPMAKLCAVFDPITVDTNTVDDEQAFWAQDLDAVIIASPSDRHAQQVSTAIEKDLHVFCEKPLDKSLAAHILIKKLLEKSQVKLQIGFNRRFDRDFARIKAVREKYPDHRAHLLKITSRDPSPPGAEYLKNCGGLFFDMTIHDFDMARFLMGSDITEVFVRGARLIQPPLDHDTDIDTAIITLKFENGAYGVIDNSRRSNYGYDQRAEIFGAFGSIKNDNHRDTSVERYNEAGTVLAKPQEFFLERYQESYLNEMTIFVDTCLSNKPISPNINDAIAALRVAMACDISLKENRPVKV